MIDSKTPQNSIHKSEKQTRKTEEVPSEAKIPTAAISGLISSSLEKLRFNIDLEAYKEDHPNETSLQHAESAQLGQLDTVYAQMKSSVSELHFSELPENIQKGSRVVSEIFDGYTLPYHINASVSYTMQIEQPIRKPDDIDLQFMFETADDVQTILERLRERTKPNEVTITNLNSQGSEIKLTAFLETTPGEEPLEMEFFAHEIKENPDGGKNRPERLAHVINIWKLEDGTEIPMAGTEDLINLYMTAYQEELETFDINKREYKNKSFRRLANVMRLLGENNPAIALQRTRDIVVSRLPDGVEQVPVLTAIDNDIVEILNSGYDATNIETYGTFANYEKAVESNLKMMVERMKSIAETVGQHIDTWNTLISKEKVMTMTEKSLEDYQDYMELVGIEHLQIEEQYLTDILKSQPVDFLLHEPINKTLREFVYRPMEHIKELQLIIENQLIELRS